MLSIYDECNNIVDKINTDVCLMVYEDKGREEYIILDNGSLYLGVYYTLTDDETECVKIGTERAEELIKEADEDYYNEIKKQGFEGLELVKKVINSI